MLCPFCGHVADKVVDSRESKPGDAIRRRRECLRCEQRFTTYERIDEIPYMVVKKDSRREKFDRQKVLNGLLRASEKDPSAWASSKNWSMWLSRWWLTRRKESAQRHELASC